MSKNLTRKGLAFGALVALGSSVLAGAPAYAVDTVVLAGNYSSDTTLATAVTETYTLNASLAPGSVAANISQLKYKVVAPVGTQANYTTDNDNGVGGGTTPATGNTDTAGTALYVAALAPSATTTNTIALSIQGASAITPTVAVSVTAFLDANNNNIFDSGETSAVQSVSFVKYSAITTTTTIAPVTEGDTAVSATVKFTNINNQSLDSSEVGAYFTKGDGSAFTVPSYTLSGTVAVLSNVATVTTATAHNLSVGDIVVVASSTGTLTNGTYVVTAVPTATTYSFAFTAADGALTTTAAVFTSFPTVLKTRVAYSATASGFKYTTGTVYSTGTTGLAKSSAVQVQPLFKGTALVIADGASSTAVAAVEVGTAQTLAVVARGLASLTGSAVLSTTADAGATPDVALNKEKQVYFLAKDTATTVPAGGNPKAGQTVSVAVSLAGGAALSATTGVTLTVNGTTYSSAATLPGATGVAKLALTTGADGKAVITYKTTGFSNGHDVVFTATAENYTATVTANEETLAYTQYIENNEGNTAVTTDGAAVSVVVVVQDQFGGAAADGAFQIAATEVANNQVTAATSGTGSDTFALVTGGKATLSLKDNGTGVGTAVFGLVRYSVNSNGVVSTPVDMGGFAVTTAPAFSTTFATGAATTSAVGNDAFATRFDLEVKTAADIAAGEVVLNATLGGAALSKNTGLTAYVLATNATAGNRVNGASDDEAQLAYSAFATQDGRKIAVPAVTITGLSAATDVSGTANEATPAVNDGGVLIYGTVNSASTSTYGGVAIPSASVTISGKGMMFVVTQDTYTVYGEETLTFNAGSAGTFTVTAYSHMAGKNLVTVKSGTGTSVLETNFKAAAELAATVVTAKVADGAAQFQAGRALDVTVTVADKFGNPVALDATWTASTDAKLTIAQTGSGYLSTTGDVVVTSTGSYANKLITNFGDLGTSTITVTLNYFDTTKTDIVASNSSEFGVTDADVTVGGRAVYASVEFAKGKTVSVTVDGKRLYSKLMSTDAYTELKFTQKKAGKHTVTVRISGGIVYSESVTTTK